MPKHKLKETILSHASAVLCLAPEEISDNRRLADLGMDSIIGVELINRLNKEFGADLKKSVLYEYPDIGQLTTFIDSLTAQEEPAAPDPPAIESDELSRKMEELVAGLPADVLERFQDPSDLADYVLENYRDALFNSSDNDEAPVARIVEEQNPPKGAIAVVGMSGRYPGARDLETFWEHLKGGKNCITQIPGHRWDYRDYYDPDKEAPGKTYSKWGGFIEDVELFDPLFFNISPREAVTMDPQVRLMLETVWHTLEDGGYTRQAINDMQAQRKRAGIFIGCMYNQYSWLARDERIGEALSNMSYWSIVNRCSYFFNFKGPSVAIDTACSSSLSAVHMACESIRNGGCEIAIAGGVNLNLHPGKYLVLKDIGLLGSGDKSRSLGDGDGYIPGEGVGAVLLRDLDSAEKNGDHIYGVILGSAVNHGGQTDGFTLPNPDAQAEVIEEVLEKTGVKAEEIGYVEVSATGSPVGDKAEFDGLSKVFQSRTEQTGFCSIGSVKANLGHLEAAAGIAQLTKVMLQLYHQSIVPTINAQPLNPEITLEGTPFRLQGELAAWQPAGQSRRAVVNSFGAGGSNAHMMVEEYPPVEAVETKPQIGAQVIVLSAANNKSLDLYARRFIDFLSGSTVSFEKLAFTLQTGREAMAERLALVVETIDETLEGLTSFCDGKELGANVFRGSVPEDQQPAPPLPADQIGSDRSKLAECWVEGIPIDWKLLYPQGSPGKISLPVYPFSRKRYWIDSVLNPSQTEQPASIPVVREASDDRDYTSDVRELLSSVLDISPSDIKDKKRFMELGMDSILGVEFIKKLNATFGVNLKATVLYDHSTVASMARYLSQTGGAVQERISSEPRPAVISHESRIACKGFLIEGVGGIDGVRMKDVEVPPPNDSEVQVKVVASAMNFADILCVKGLYPTMPDYPFVAGFQVSGVVARVGGNVTRFREGDRVVAMTGFSLGGHAEYTNTHEGLVAHKPDNVSFKDMCGFPDAFVTAYYCLYEIGNLKSGEHVLIQSAAGAVGLMAVQLAKARNAVVYGTASSREKLDYLKSIGVDYVINYMEEDFLERVMELSDNRGVDIVLNTLSGDAIQKGIDCLAEEGRYLEIAVAGLRASQKLDLSNMTGNQSFHSIDLRKLWRNYERVRQYLDAMVDMVKGEVVKPIVFKSFPSSLVKEALDYIASRKSIGKVALEFSSEEQPEAVVQGGELNIAVIGLSGRFPGATDIRQFWDNLSTGIDSIVEIPEQRWDIHRYYDPDITAINKTNSRWGGFLEQIDRFDPLFFNITPMEAELMDPQQRLFLEESWKVIEDAGYSPMDLSGVKCGVFVGVGPGDYSANTMSTENQLNTYSLIGSINSILSGRISYFLNLLGPNIAVDTACSSSLVATHLACRSIASGESDIAIAGGVNIMTTPVMHIMVSKADLLSPNGRCRVFDNDADGFVPGEGVGVVLMKPLDRARQDRDHVYGVIAASSVNQDGQTNGITAPSMESQVRLETEAYERHGIHPETIGYIEAHGTGTKLGDPIELEALNSAFAKRTGKKQFCAIGSVKSNIGHGLASAGIAGLIKVLLCLNHKKLVPSLHYDSPNEHFDFENSPFFVNTNLREWEAEEGRPRMAAVSSFGFSGTNAHIVLKENPPDSRHMAATSGLWYLMAISAKTPEALESRARDLLTWVRDRGSRHSIGDISFTLLAGRTHFQYRLGFVVQDIDELERQLELSISEGFASVQPVVLQEDSVGGRLAGWASAEGDGTDNKEMMEKWAELYIDGLTADWNELFRGTDFRRISMPTYPFAYEHYWRPDPLDPPSEHRLIENLSGDLEGNGLTGRLNVDPSCFIDAGVGKKHLAGLFFLEAALAAGRMTSGETVVHVKNVSWGRPVFWLESPPEFFIRLRLTSVGLAFEVNDGSPAPYCVVYVQGNIVPAPGESGGYDHQSPLEGGVILPHGDCRYLKEIRCEGAEAVARFSFPMASGKGDQESVLSPHLIQGLTRALMILAENGSDNGALAPLFPFSLETMAFRGIPAGDIYMSLYFKESGDSGFGPGRYDVVIWSDQEGVLLYLKGLVIRRDSVDTQQESLVFQTIH